MSDIGPAWVRVNTTWLFRICSHREFVASVAQLGDRVTCEAPQKQRHLHLQVNSEDGIYHATIYACSQQGMRFIAGAIEMEKAIQGLTVLVMNDQYVQNLPSLAAPSEMTALYVWRNTNLIH